jgi:hypothetical protein
LSQPISGLPSKLPFLYRLVVEQPSLENIIIMLDNSKFEDDPAPHNFSLSNPVPLGKSHGGGGRWGRLSVRNRLTFLFEEFFTNPGGSGKEIEMYRKFRENNPECVVPSFRMLSITKTPKHGYAFDGLPVAKNRGTSGSKARK